MAKEKNLFLYWVQHRPNGNWYLFGSNQQIPNNRMVICSTCYGRAIGWVVQTATLTDLQSRNTPLRLCTEATSRDLLRAGWYEIEPQVWENPEFEEDNSLSSSMLKQTNIIKNYISLDSTFKSARLSTLYYTIYNNTNEYDVFISVTNSRYYKVVVYDFIQENGFCFLYKNTGEYIPQQYFKDSIIYNTIKNIVYNHLYECVSDAFHLAILED